MNFQKPSAALVAASSLILNALANEPSSTDATVDLDPLVVTSAQTADPNRVTFDPQIAIQPLPANDGADALKHIAGINVIRKGGTDGDPTFRGMAGSRLPVVLDGVTSLGGCGFRMDPPTAYVFPSSFDEVTLLKGPQSVRYGPGSSAGVVLFERATPRLIAGETSGSFISTIADHGRRELSLSALTGNPSFYARFQGSYAEADNYTDGSGRLVNSAYQRWNTQTSLGYTPSENAVLELSLSLSDGEAAYADRGMDGVAFDRTAYSLRYEADQLDGIFRSVEAIAYHSYVDHVMDNFSLREFTPTMMMAMPMSSNPDRLTTGGSLRFELDPQGSLEISFGFDAQSNRHRVRNAMGANASNFAALPFVEDGNFDQVGTFTEIAYRLDESNTLIAGARIDSWQATDLRQTIATGHAGMAMPNPTSGKSRSDPLASGYLRLESNLDQKGTKLFAGLGRAERFPDYWERFSKESSTSISAFDTNPETVTQLDLGYQTAFADFRLTSSLFYAEHDDYILIESAFPKAMGMMNRTTTISRNIDATTYGGEIELSYQNDDGYYAASALAYTHGTNETDHRPLGQISPLELKLEGGIRRQAWSAGFIARFVDSQDRYALNQGNIVGQDIGPSDSFEVVSLHSSYRLNEYWSLAAGIDNLFDVTYAEHISRGGSMVNGFVQTLRINEPGRTAWTRLNAQF